MYVHPAFRMEHSDALAFLRERAFGTLVLPAANAAPVAAHVPFLINERGPDALEIELHVAKANALHTLVGDGCPALLIVQGPDAYISPDWYGVPNQVPTWTYVAVHVTGRARLLPPSGHLDHADRLSAQFEERLLPKTPWTSAKMDTKRRDAMMNAIVGIGLDVEEIQAQKKLIQHKGDVEHRGAIAGLRALVDPGSAAIAALMEETLAHRKPRDVS
jgi:transcriptional regulator